MRIASAGLALAMALGAVVLAAPSEAATFEGYSTTAVNQRTGPSTGYPVIQVIPANARVRIYGCLSGITWCDTSYAGQRGWVSSRYLQIYGVNRTPRPIMRFGFSSGLPLVQPWWDRPGNFRRPPHDRFYHPGDNNDRPPFPPPGSGNHFPPPGSGNQPPPKPVCGVPGRPPCQPGGGAGNPFPPGGGNPPPPPNSGNNPPPPPNGGNNPPPRFGGGNSGGGNKPYPPMCGQPGHPPCQNNTDRQTCGRQGQPPCPPM